MKSTSAWAVAAMLACSACGAVAQKDSAASPPGGGAEPIAVATEGVPPPPPPPLPPPRPDEEAEALEIEVDLSAASSTGTPKPKLRDSKDESFGEPKKKTVQATTSRSAGRTLDADEVQRAVTEKMNELRGCLRADLVVQLEATVGRDGRVEDVRATGSQPDDSQARDCVAFALRGASLGETGAAESATFRLRLSLRRR
jgi:hypothetical protein